MAQLFRPGANPVAGVIMASIVVAPILAVLLTFALWESPYATYQYITRNQPVPFSHEHHVGRLGIDCRYCHTGVEQAAFAGLPSTHTCMTCHSQIWNTAAVLQPVRESLAQRQPLHWIRVNRVPDFVYFDHSIHVAKGIGCTTCHGAIGAMPLTYRAEPLTMGWCLTCHRHPEQFVRPLSEVFNPDWTPPPDQDRLGPKLVRQYLVKTEGLTDCSRCHR
jgi:hypothetical protein